MEESKPKKMRSYRYHPDLLEAVDERAKETSEDKTEIIEKALERELLKSNHLEKPIL